MVQNRLGQAPTKSQTLKNKRHRSNGTKLRRRSRDRVIRWAVLVKEDRRAIALPIFAIMFAAMLAFLGLLFDGGRIYFEKRRMQVAADAGAFGGAHELLRGKDDTMIESGGRDDAALNGFTHGRNTVNTEIKHPPDSGSRAGDPGCVEAEVSQQFPTTLMRIAGHTTSTVATRAVACVEISDESPCVLALHCGSDQPGLEFNGTGNLTAYDCDVVVNSKSDEAIRVNGTGGGCPMLHTTGDGQVAYGTGGATLQNGANDCITCEGCDPPDYQPHNDIWCMKDPYCSNYVSNNPASGYPGYPGTSDYCDPMPDPWNPSSPPTPDFDIPIITGTNYNDGVTFPACPPDAGLITMPCFDGTAVQLPAGYYGGQGIRMNGGVVNLLCAAPVYGCLFLADQFRINGGNISGTGVTIYITPVGNGELDIGGNAGVPPNSVNLVAPTDGSYANILFFNSRYATKDCTVIGDSTLYVEGGIYCPTGHLTYGGNSVYDASSVYVAIIADTIEISGTPNLGINYTGSGRAPTTSTVLLVE